MNYNDFLQQFRTRTFQPMPPEPRKPTYAGQEAGNPLMELDVSSEASIRLTEDRPVSDLNNPDTKWWRRGVTLRGGLTWEDVDRGYRIRYDANGQPYKDVAL